MEQMTMDLTNEEWRAIPGQRGYMVSDLGRIKSPLGRVLRASTSGRGYLGVILRGPDRLDQYITVHRAVLFAFKGPCPDGHEARHINSVKTDNRAVNLEWTTPEQNRTDRLADGGYGRGNLTPEVVRQMRAEWNGVTVGVVTLARKYGVGKNTVQAIIQRRTWKHL